MQPNQSFPVRQVHLGTFARLVEEIPELALHSGDVGVIRGFQPGPIDAYEVEFHRVGQDVPLRALLLGRQVEPQEGPLLSGADAPQYWSW